jgi:hypothetical protein
MRSLLLSSPCLLGVTALAMAAPPEPDTAFLDHARVQHTAVTPGVVRSVAVQGDARALRQRAEEGDHSAQLALGFAYALGKGLARDLAQAITWLTRASEGGNSTAQYNLAIVHVARGEFPDAQRWFKIASERGRNDMPDKARFSSHLVARVTPPPQTRMAVRDAGDWMEEFEPNPRANGPDDGFFEFRRLPVPDHDLGWRAAAVVLQRAARESLGLDPDGR